jgi:hypothetical protein
MRDDGLMRRLRAARPAAGEPVEHDALFERIVAEQGDRRLVEGRSSPLFGQGARLWTRARRARPRLLIGATGAVAASAAAVTLLVSVSASPAPAFAVTVHARSVSVKIYRQSGIAGANRKLAAMGIDARISDVKDGQSITLPCVAPGPGPNGHSFTIAGYPKGYASAGGPAVGSTWHVVACSSIVNTGSSGHR